MARRPSSRGARRFEETDRPSSFLSSGFERYAPYGSAFVRPEDDTLWGVSPLFTRIRLAHGLTSPLEVGTIYNVLDLLSDPLPWWSDSYSEAYSYPVRGIRHRSIHSAAEKGSSRKLSCRFSGLLGNWRIRGQKERSGVETNGASAFLTPCPPPPFAFRLRLPVCLARASHVAFEGASVSGYILSVVSIDQTGVV
jgi:hypothetical protein